MWLQVDSPDTRRFAIRMHSHAGELTAAMSHEGVAGWQLRYEIRGNVMLVEIAPSRTPWPTALRRALAECEIHAGG